MPIICDKNLLLLTFSACPVKCEFASVIRLLVCLLACRPLMKISLLFICLFLKNCQVSTFNFFCKKKKWLSPCHVTALKTFKVYNLKSWQGIQFPDTWFWRVSIFSFTCKTWKVSLAPVRRSFGYLFSYFKAAFGWLDWGVDTWKLEQMFALSMCELLAGHFFPC